MIVATVWVCAVFGAAQAQRSGPPRAVAVIDATAAATSDPEVTGLATRIEAQLDREEDLVPVGPDRRPALVGAVADERSSALSEARSALARARDALARFDREEAIKEAECGMRRAIEIAPGAETTRLVADLAFLRGVAQFDQGKAPEAAESFALVHRLDAGRKLDPIKYVPELIEVFDKAAVAGAQTSLDIDAPAGASAWLDGVEVGPAPITVQVAVGDHVVTVTGDRLVTRGQLVTAISGGTTVRLDAAEASGTIKIHRLRRRLAAAATDDERAAAVRAVVRQVGAQDAIVVGRSNGSLVTWIYSGRTGAIVEPQPAADVEAVDVIKPLRPLRPAQLPGDGITKPLPPPVPWYRKRWVQASIGGTIVASVIATVVVVLSQPEGTSPVGGVGFGGETQAR
jgi:hypothetical protein